MGQVFRLGLPIGLIVCRGGLFVSLIAMMGWTRLNRGARKRK
jgi:hypothetical protein